MESLPVLRRPEPYEPHDDGLRRALGVLRRRWPIVVLAVASGLGAAAAASWLQQPQVRAETTLVVGPAKGTPTPAEADAIAATATALLRSDVVAAGVVRSLGLSESRAALLDRVSVSHAAGSSVLRVRVRAHEPVLAQRIAQELGLVFGRVVSGRSGVSLTVGVFDAAHVLPGKAAPLWPRNLAVGAALGLLLGLFAAFFVDAAVPARVR